MQIATTTSPEVPKPVPPVLDVATRSFVKRSLTAGLVEIEDLKKVVVSLMQKSPDFTPARLAEGLVNAGILTQWQATKLLAGKSKGFYLGSYRLLRPLGRGGMGVVYLGEHHVMKRMMALKILPPEAHTDPRRIQRFKDEAKASAQLDHPNIVRAYDFSEAGSKLYIVMEYVDGIDLQRAVIRDGRMSVPEALDVLAQSVRGLAHAHQRGIIHRDIKPSNLMLRTDGVVKVSDLGLARIGWAEGDGASQRLLGTADFVAPEQAINSRNVDARADIYSLGCTMYFLLVGKAPFDGSSITQRLANHQTAPVPDVRTLRPECPATLAELTMRMMAKRPDDRPKSAVELLAQLARFSSIASDDSRHRLRGVAPAGDISIDDAVYQATIEDSSLSADVEVEIDGRHDDQAGEFDFASLPPMEIANLAPARPVAMTSVKGQGRAVASKSRADKVLSPHSNTQSGNQQVLLGIGLAVAVLALVAVVGMGFHSISRPLPKETPRIKATEDDKGKVVFVVHPNSP